MNEEKVLILSATPYDFKDESSGNQIKGLTIWLLPLSSKDQYTNGIKPVKYSLPLDLQRIFDGLTLPAFANMEFDFDFSRNRLKPSSFHGLVEMEVGG